MTLEKTLREKLEGIRLELDSERQSFMSHWRELADYFLPRRARFTITDNNQGNKRNQKILDNTPTLAARALRSGMHGGLTSPARPWFRLTTPNPELAENESVKKWLSDVTKRLQTIFIKSNLYNILPIVYGDIGVFGTNAMLIEEDFDSVLRVYTFPVGTYWISNNDKGIVDVFFREFRMTVRQIVSKFAKMENGEVSDWGNISETVKNAWTNNTREQWIEMVHCIIPNEKYDDKKIDAKFKKYLSAYYEKGTAGGNGYKTGDVLRESGYDRFPILTTRWEVASEDVYGTDCPGMTALGDNKQLQTGEKRGAQALEKFVNPPMGAPSSLMHKKTSILPGDITYYDVREGQQGFKPIHEIDPRLGDLEAKQQQIRHRVDRAFFVDLFLMLANDERNERPTAREIDAKTEEKLLALGPVLEQLNQDLLDPLIDIVFEYANRQGQIPVPPTELQGSELKVEYISIMAQAQKMAAIGTLERFIAFASQLAGVSPDALDKIDLDQTIDEYGEMTGIAPGVIRPDDVVETIRNRRAQQAQQQQQAAALNQAAGAAKSLSQAEVSPDNALGMMVQQSKAGQMVPA